MIKRSKLFSILLMMAIMIQSLIPMNAYAKSNEEDNKIEHVHNSQFNLPEETAESLKWISFEEDNSNIINEWFIRTPLDYHPWGNDWNLDFENGQATIFSATGCSVSTINGGGYNESRRSPELMQNVKVEPNTKYTLEVDIEWLSADSSYLVVNNDDFGLKDNGYTDGYGINRPWPEKIFIEKEVYSDANGIIPISIYLQHHPYWWSFSCSSLGFTVTRASIKSEKPKTTRWVEKGNESNSMKKAVTGKVFEEQIPSFNRGEDTYEFIESKVSKDGLIKTYYYKLKEKPKTTRWVEIGNESNSMKKAVTGKDFEEQIPSFNRGEDTYEFIESKVSKDGLIKTYYYKLKEKPKTTRWVEKGNESNSLKKAVTGKNFEEQILSFNRGEDTYEFIESKVSKDGLIKTYYYKLKEKPKTTRWVEIGNESNSMKKAVTGKDFEEQIPSFNRGEDTYEFIESKVSKDGLIKTYYYKLKEKIKDETPEEEVKNQIPEFEVENPKKEVKDETHNRKNQENSYKKDSSIRTTPKTSDTTRIGMDAIISLLVGFALILIRKKRKN